MNSIISFVALRSVARRAVDLPELNILFFAFLLHFSWEMLQVPLYAELPGATHWEGIRTCLHATLGDVGIALVAFWCGALVGRSRQWFRWRNRTAFWVYVGLGLVATLVLERVATGSSQRWLYAPAMPIVPLLDVGLSPILQWLVLPPVVLWITRRQLQSGVNKGRCLEPGP